MLSFKFRYLALLLTVFMMSSAHAGVITLTAESAGFGSASPPGYARLKIDGVDALGGLSTRGVNVAVIDQITGDLLSTSAYDTHAYASQSSLLESFINNLDLGNIVMIGVQDEGTGQLTAGARDAIASLGGSAGNILNAGFRGSYALIGVAGAGVGTRTAFEAFAPQNTSPVSVTTSITVAVPAPISAVIFLSGLALLGLRRTRKA